MVEDEATVRALIIATFHSLGYRTLEAGDGADALQVLKESDEPVALLFTDVAMPGGMNGLELARIVRDDQPNVRVLFTSGYAQDALLKNGGFQVEDEFLPKPYSRDQLADKVANAIRAPQQN